jgi:hypothetical protein
VVPPAFHYSSVKPTQAKDYDLSSSAAHINVEELMARAMVVFTLCNSEDKDGNNAEGYPLTHGTNLHVCRERLALPFEGQAHLLSPVHSEGKLSSFLALESLAPSTALLVGVLPAALMDTCYVSGLFEDTPASSVEPLKVSMVCVPCSHLTPISMQAGKAAQAVEQQCHCRGIRKTGRLWLVLPQDQTRAKPEPTRPDQTKKMTRAPEDHFVSKCGRWKAAHILMDAGVDLGYLLAHARDVLASAAERWKKESGCINHAKNRLDTWLRRVWHRAVRCAAEDS